MCKCFGRRLALDLFSFFLSILVFIFAEFVDFLINGLGLFIPKCTKHAHTKNWHKKLERKQEHRQTKMAVKIVKETMEIYTRAKKFGKTEIHFFIFHC